MTANQRRPGFRLPWSSADGAPEPEDVAATAAEPAAGVAAASSGVEAAPAAADGVPPVESAGAAAAATNGPGPDRAVAPAGKVVTDPAQPGRKGALGSSSTFGATGVTPPAEAKPPAAVEEASAGFLHDLVVAMRRVAEEARQAELTGLHQRTDEHVARLEAEVERRREELRQRAEQDISGVGEWAKAEAQRIKAEAEQRVAARRAQLDRQIAAEGARGEAEANALRQRVTEYERELDAFHAQLAEITDPAAFAAAAKRVPQPPALEIPPSSITPAAPATEAPATEAPATEVPATETPAETPETPAAEPDAAGAATNGVPSQLAVHPAEEEVLAARLAELDAKLAGGTQAGPDPATTEIVVKGLGSFGAITGFRQSLAAMDGIQGVALSLGHSGEFIFRAAHAPGFDVAAAVRSLEGSAATVEVRPEGGLVVTIERAG